MLTVKLPAAAAAGLSLSALAACGTDAGPRFSATGLLLVLEQDPVLDQLVQVHQHRHAFPRWRLTIARGADKSSGNGRWRHFPDHRARAAGGRCPQR